MTGPFIVQLGQRPSPFDPAEQVETYVGVGHAVQHARLALAFASRDEADQVASRFDLAEVVDASSLAFADLDTILFMACPTPQDFLSHVDASPEKRASDRQRWIAALCSADARCPATMNRSRMTIWALCGEDVPVQPDNGTGHGHAAPAP